MATRPKRSHAKKSVKRVSAAKIGAMVIREEAVPKAPALVLVNAITPDEKLSEPAVEATESAVQTIEKSLQAAMPAARAVNEKLLDIAQTNMNSSLELARDLAGAKTPMEALRLQMTYWQDHMSVFEAQAQELRTVAGEFMATAAEPMRAHLRRM